MNETVEVYPKQYESILKATLAMGFPQLSELPIGSFLAALAAPLNILPIPPKPYLVLSSIIF